MSSFFEKPKMWTFHKIIKSLSVIYDLKKLFWQIVPNLRSISKPVDISSKCLSTNFLMDLSFSQFIVELRFGTFSNV